MKRGKPEGVDSSYLLRVSILGSTISKEGVDGLRKLFSDADIIPVYAQTETGMITSFQVDNKAHKEFYRRNPDSVGLPVRGFMYKVRLYGCCVVRLSCFQCNSELTIRKFIILCVKLYCFDKVNV